MYGIINKPIIDFFSSGNIFNNIKGGGGICSENKIEIVQSYCCIVLSLFICYNLYLYYLI
jgi:hypothetical protein